MQTLICGRKPQFGDKEQIAAIHQERARISELQEWEQEHNHKLPEEIYTNIKKYAEFADDNDLKNLPKCVKKYNASVDYVLYLPESHTEHLSVYACDVEDAKNKVRDKLYYDDGYEDDDIDIYKIIVTEDLA